MSRREKTLPGMISRLLLDRLGDELGARAPGSAGEGVEGPFGEGELEVLAQRLDDHVALAAVGLDLRRSGPGRGPTTPAYWPCSAHRRS